MNFAEPLPTTSIVLSPDIGIDAGAFAGVPGGVMKSTDAGKSWEVTGLASPPPMVAAMAISPNYVEDGVVFVGSSEDGVFRSASRGSSWSRWNFGLLDLTAYCFAISPNYAVDETLFVGVESGLFRSTNGGRAWREVDLPVGFDPVLSMAISPNYENDGVIFAGTETKGLLRSTDRGQNWVLVGTDVIELSVNGILISSDYPDKQDIVVLHESKLLLSRDDGMTWTTITTVFDDVTAILAPQGLHTGASLLAGLLDGSVYKVKL